MKIDKGGRAETRLRHVFDMAKIEYGRIDYGVHRGEPQAWEINLNPTFSRRARRSGEARREVYGHLRDEGREVIHRRLLEAFKSLELPAPVPTFPLRLGNGSGEPLRVTTRDGARPTRRRQLWQVVGASRAAQAIKPAVLSLAGALGPTLSRLVRSRH